jgi:hypothetical protein
MQQCRQRKSESARDAPSAAEETPEAPTTPELVALDNLAASATLPFRTPVERFSDLSQRTSRLGRRVAPGSATSVHDQPRRTIRASRERW